MGDVDSLLRTQGILASRGPTGGFSRLGASGADGWEWQDLAGPRDYVSIAF